MNFFDQVASLIRASATLEDLGRGLARVLDTGHLSGYVYYGSSERCLVTVPYATPEITSKIQQQFEHGDWRSRPREAFLAAFATLGVSTGEIGEGVEWGFLGPDDKPLGAFACVRDPTGPSPAETERRAVDFFYRLVRELPGWRAITSQREREAFERNYLVDALQQVGRLMLERPARERLLPSLLKIALDAARSEVGSILLLSEGRFTTEVEWGLPGELLENVRFLPEDEGLVDRIQRTLEPVIVDDFSGPTVRVPPRFPVRITGLVAIPLLAGDRLIGTLNVATGEEGREMLWGTVASLTTIAIFIATALENIRLEEALTARARKADRGLAEEQHLLRRVLGSLRDGVLVSDPAGSLAISNLAAEEMLGLGSAAAGRYPERNVVTLRPFFAWLRDAWSSNDGREDLEFPLALSPPAVFGVTIAPLTGDSGAQGHVTVIRDLTEDRTRAALRREEMVKIAAEIETAVGSVRAGLGLLASNNDPHGPIYRRVVHRGLGRMVALAEDLRDRVRLEESTFELERTEVSLEDALRDASGHFRDEIEEKRIEFRGPDPSACPPLLADRAQLVRALSRLFGIAVRFTAEHGLLRAGVELLGDVQRVSLVFLHGPDAAELEALLEGGTPAEAADAGTSPADLGLALARRRIELHGGTIRFHLSGAEARLNVDLPVLPLPASSGGARASSVPAPAASLRRA